ncbi:hypothetical protein EV122DRAFT_226313 [Schizophyllum commune]
MESTLEVQVAQSYVDLQKLHELAYLLTDDDEPQDARPLRIAQAKALFYPAFLVLLADAPSNTIPYHHDSVDFFLFGFRTFSALCIATKRTDSASLIPMLQKLSPQIVKWTALFHPTRRRIIGGQNQRNVRAEISELCQVYTRLLDVDPDGLRTFLRRNPDFATQVFELWLEFTNHIPLLDRSDDQMDGRLACLIATMVLRLQGELAAMAELETTDDKGCLLDALRRSGVTKRSLYRIIGPHILFMCRFALDPGLAPSTWGNYLLFTEGLLCLPDFEPSRIPRDVISSAVTAARFCLHRRDYISSSRLVRFIDTVCSVARDNRPLVLSIRGGIFRILHELDSAPTKADITPFVQRMCAGIVHAKVLRAFKRHAAAFAASAVGPIRGQLTWQNVRTVYEAYQVMYYTDEDHKQWKHYISCHNSQGPHAQLVRMCPCGDAFYCSGSCQRMHWKGAHGSECRASDGPWGLGGVVSLLDIAFLFCIVRAQNTYSKANISKEICELLAHAEDRSRHETLQVVIMTDFSTVLPRARHKVCLRAIKSSDIPLDSSAAVLSCIAVEATFYFGRTVATRLMPFTYPLNLFRS